MPVRRPVRIGHAADGRRPAAEERRTSRILYVAPIGADAAELAERDIARHLQPGNELTLVSLPGAPQHVEYHYYETLVLPDLVHAIREAETAGYDAAVIGCFYDLGLHEGREVTDRLVVTARCESSLLLAASLGDTFSIIVGRRKWIPQMRANVRLYGLESRLASLRALDLGVVVRHADEARTAARFLDAGGRAVAEDGAEVIVLGCTTSAGFCRDLQARLGVPVIDAALAAVKRAEHLVELRDRFGWSHSKIGGHESPPEAEIAAWHLRETYARPTSIAVG